MFCYAEVFNQDIGAFLPRPLARRRRDLGPAQETGASTTPRPSTACSTAPRPSTRTSAGARSRPCTARFSPHRASRATVFCRVLCFPYLFDLFSVAVTLRRRQWRGAYGVAEPNPLGPPTREIPPRRHRRVAYARRRRPARRPCRGPGGARGVRAREDAGADAGPGGASLQRRPLRRAAVRPSRLLPATGPNAAGPRRVRRLQVHYEEG